MYRIHQYFDDNRTNQFTLQAGGRHLFDLFDMEYKIGWGHGSSQGDGYRVRFGHAAPRLDYAVNIEDRLHPDISIPAHSPRRQITSSEVLRDRGSDSYELTRHTDNQFMATVDFDAPVRFGSFKYGASVLSEFQSGMSEYHDMGRTFFSPADFQQLMNNSWNVFDREGLGYEINWLIDRKRYISTFNQRYPMYEKDEDRFGEADASRYHINDNIFAAYGMTKLSYSIFSLLGGVRVEHTRANYEAREAIFNPNGRYMGSTIRTVTPNHTHLFPNAQLIARLTNFTNIRAAYSRSIGRPHLTQISPYIVWNYESRRVSYGDPELKPMLSNNLDFLVEHYFMGVGQISVGLFYKELEDFIYSQTRRVGPDGITDMRTPDDNPVAYAGWERRTYFNGEEATVYGLELSWQQNLSFLPGFLGYSGIYFNYSYTYSETDIGRLDDRGETVLTRLQTQRPHVVNAGVDYTRGRFTGQISYQWSDAYIGSYAHERDWVPAIQMRERVYRDSFTDGANDLSLTLRYGITDYVRVWLNGTNLTNSRSIDYEYDRDFYPREQSLRGTQITLGIQLNM